MSCRWGGDSSCTRCRFPSAEISIPANKLARVTCNSQTAQGEGFTHPSSLSGLQVQYHQLASHKGEPYKRPKAQSTAASSSIWHQVGTVFSVPFYNSIPFRGKFKISPPGLWYANHFERFF